MIRQMALCKNCRGKFMATVEIILKQYGENGYFSYRTLSCPCQSMQVLPSGNNDYRRGREQSELLPPVPSKISALKFTKEDIKNNLKAQGIFKK